MALNGNALGNTVGGTLPGEGNTIAFNGGNGISTSFVLSRSPKSPVPASRINQRNAFLSNSIHSNFGIGIDLGDDGVTDNDTNDVDVDANLLQNFPELASLTSANGSTTVEGTLNSKPNATYRLEFFDNAAFDSSSFGEGERFIGATDVTTDGNGNASFSAIFSVSIAEGHVVTATATATDAANNTSEFSGRRPDESPGPTADLRVTKSDDPDPAQQLQAVTYTVTVFNDGPDEATNVALIDTLPDGVAFDSVTSSQGVCGAAGDSVVCDLGSIANGSTATVEIKVIPENSGSITNTVSVSSSEFDPNADNNTAIADTLVNPGADLSITKSPFGATTIGLGFGKTFKLTVKNNGPAFASGVIATDTLPDSMSFSFISGNTPCSHASGVITCNFGNLFPGVEASVTYSVTVNELGLITNRAEVTSSTVDPNTDNNTAAVDITVLPNANLRLAMSADLDVVRVNEPLTYSLTITNNGPSDAEGVMLIDTLPEGVAFDSASPSQGSCDETGGIVTCDLGGLADDSEATVDIVAIPTVSGTFITNSAEVTGSPDFIDFQSDNNATLETIVSVDECPAPLYGITSQFRSSSVLYAIDSETGAAAPVGPIGFERVIAMDFAPQTGILYATGRRDPFGATVLILIDPCTGVGTEVGPTEINSINFNNEASDISFRNSDSALYAFLRSQSDLATIDTATGLATLVGNTSPADSGGIAFSLEDILYHADDTSLNVLDQATGEATVAVSLNFSPPADEDSEIKAMDFDPETGTLVASLRNEGGDYFLTTVDITTGDVTVVGPTVQDLDAPSLSSLNPPLSRLISRRR